MAESRLELEFRARSARLLLFLTILHTIPVLWLTPVAGGTLPTVVLLGIGLAGLFSFDAEGLALGLMALVPALLYLGLSWFFAWLLERVMRSLAHGLRLAALGGLALLLLLAVYFPIYFSGGHGSTSSDSLLQLAEMMPRPELLLAYWISLHLVLGGLYAVQISPETSAASGAAVRWSRPLLRLWALLVVGGLVWVNSENVLCRPLAHLGMESAQVCLARAGGVESRYWYERAALDGNSEALGWLIENTPDRRVRLEWLRSGARGSVPAIQYQLALHLERYGGDPEEAARWMEAAAAADYGPAQMVHVEALTAEVTRTQSRELLAERNSLLELAAQNGSTLARLRLAEHYSRGSMGYAVDLERARRHYEVLASVDFDAEIRVEARALRLVGHSFQSRLAEVDRWRAGLAANDPQVSLQLGKLYLQSPLPGPGVRAAGMELLQQVAAHDPAVRRELVSMLRTGSDGVERNLPAAREWLLAAARDGEVEAMTRVAGNFMSGREGFLLDYPQARGWIEKLVAHYRRVGGQNAELRIDSLQDDLRYIDRLGEIAGEPLLGARELEMLSARADAESLYRYGLQLLAGGGAPVRAEAVSRLQAAADLDHAEASWRLVQIYEHGFQSELDPEAARRELKRAAALHHFEATRELASRYEHGSKGVKENLPRAIEMYQTALVAGRDNRYGWNLNPENFNHFRWLESRLNQARLKLTAQMAAEKR